MKILMARRDHNGTQTFHGNDSFPRSNNHRNSVKNYPTCPLRAIDLPKRLLFVTDSLKARRKKWRATNEIRGRRKNGANTFHNPRSFSHKAVVCVWVCLDAICFEEREGRERKGSAKDNSRGGARGESGVVLPSTQTLFQLSLVFDTSRVSLFQWTWPKVVRRSGDQDLWEPGCQNYRILVLSQLLSPISLPLKKLQRCHAVDC